MISTSHLQRALPLHEARLRLAIRALVCSSLLLPGLAFAAPFALQDEPPAPEIGVPKARGEERTFYHENGEKARRGSIYKGRRDGLWIGWHDNGRQAYEGSFADYQRVGQWNYWFSDGTRTSSGTWKGGKQQGLWQNWYQGSEQLKVEGAFDRGRPTGPWKTFYQNGRNTSRTCETRHYKSRKPIRLATQCHCRHKP